MKAASCASAMRCPGGAIGRREPAAGSRGGAARRRIASRSRWRSAMSARCASLCARSPCSFACTSPRCRSGRARSAVARDRAEDGNAERGDGVGHELQMPLAADAIEHDAADPHVRIVRGEAAHQGRRRLRLARNVDDEQHRQSKSRGKVCRRAAAAGRAGDAVEQAHGAFDDEKIGAASRLVPPAHRSARASWPSCRD